MTKSPTVLQEIEAKIKRTELFKVMLSSGNYEDSGDVVDTILDLRDRVRKGENPEEVLHEEGFEPDYIYDLL